jgi:2-desacetyl-2-hydroxyethyl bacteriochlorophyllide A dehydrogenase
MADAKAVKCACVEKKGELTLKEQALREPGPREVLIKIEACGVCAGDHLTVDGLFPGLSFPRVPGHEVAGKILKVGEGVRAELKVGAHVGVGWLGGYCGTCDACKDGDFICCSSHLVTGISSDGGYASHMIARQEAVIVIPEGLNSVEAAPLMCAGVTVYNSLRNQPIKAGELVAVIGIGGLGHLAIQFANKMGYNVVAISSTGDKKEWAKKLGAHHFIASSEVKSLAEELQKLGGAKVVLATAPDSKSISDVLGGLARNGVILVLGSPNQPIQVPAIPMIMNRLRLQGWPSGRPRDVEDTLKFSIQTGVRSKVQEFPLSKAVEAYKAGGKVQGRAVLVMSE